MPAFRHRLTVWALLVVVCQILVVVEPVAASGVGRPGAENATACTCSHGPGTECPMHKRRVDTLSQSQPGDRDCHCCNSRPQASDATLTLVFWGGPILETRTPVPNGRSEASLVVLSMASDPTSPPTSPPPRLLKALRG